MKIVQAKDLVRELVELGELERRMITAGQLEELAGITEAREQLVARLGEALEPEAAESNDDELREWIARLEEQGRSNVTLLQSLRDEMARRLESNREERRAAKSYEKSRTL